MTKEFIVVENAGYEGEQDIRRFKTYREACAFFDKQYDEEDRERIHPEIAVEIDGERSYEI
jgi:hypothetical protein